MEFSTRWEGKVLVGVMKGELGMRDHAAMMAAVAEMAGAEAAGVVLNFSDVVYMASMGIGMLLSLVKAVKAKGIGVRMAGVRPAVRMVLEMVKADTVLPMDGTEEEAVGRVVGVSG